MADRPEAKPRTYREEARKEYLKVEKQRKRSHKTIRKAIGKQLRYIRRDLETIGDMLENRLLFSALTPRQYRNLLVVTELYRQQQEMFEDKKHRIEDRIVSISQPHVRPIVRGKESAPVEFGAKVAVSKVNEHYRIEKYKPYRNRENLAWCKEHGIRLSGPPLGRPKRDQSIDKKTERMDAAERNGIESPFGTGKRRYGLARIMAKLQCTAETVIALQFLAMNLDHKVRVCFCLLLRWVLRGSDMDFSLPLTA